MVSLKSVLVAALAATSVSAYSGRYRRQNGHSHGGNVPSIPRGGFSNTTAPAISSTTSVSLPLETGVPDVVENPTTNTTVTETATKEVHTTVTVSYTLGNGKVVTTSFTKVRQPETSSASTTKVTQTVVPVATPVVDGGAKDVSPDEEDPELVSTTSTTTTTVYTTVTRSSSSSSSFGGLNNDFITKAPTATPSAGAGAGPSECANGAPATVTETVKVPVQVVTVTSVSLSVSYVTVPAASATPTTSATFVEVPQPTSSQIATPVETETEAPSLPTVVPPFYNGTAPFFPNGTHPTNTTQSTIRVTATVVPVQSATLI